MQTRSRAVAVLCALFIIAAVATGAQERKADAQAVPDEVEQIEAEVPAEIPAEAKALRNPQPADEESVEYGRLIYNSQCAMCHGPAGKGDAALPKRLGMTVPDLTTADYRRSRSDGELFYILTHGHGKMRGEGERLAEKTRWDLVNAVRSMAD